MTIEDAQRKLEQNYYNSIRQKLNEAKIDNVEFIISLLDNEQWRIFDLQQRLCRLEDIAMRLEDCENSPKLDTEEKIFKALEHYEDKISDSEEWMYIIDNYLQNIEEE